MRILLTVLSWLPFFVLHRISDFLFLFVFHVFKYRRKVVSENIRNSFPEKSATEHARIEKRFYLNFCDYMVETIKSTSISKAELNRRCANRTPGAGDKAYAAGINLAGISAHLGNWEWFGLNIATEIPQVCTAVFKPLSSKKMNEFMIKTRGRLGLALIPMKELRNLFEREQSKSFMVGLLADQAPHDFAKAVELQFLNQKTYFFAGPGVLTVKYNLTPMWGWMRKLGRSRYEWGLDPIVFDSSDLSESERAQIVRLAKVHELTLDQAEKAYRIVKEYARLLELKITMTPEDWLWSHRRWKSR